MKNHPKKTWNFHENSPWSHHEVTMKSHNFQNCSDCRFIANPMGFLRAGVATLVLVWDLLAATEEQWRLLSALVMTMVWRRGEGAISIWLVVWNIWIIFPFSWECHHANWRTHSIIFQRIKIPPSSHSYGKSPSLIGNYGYITQLLDVITLW